MDLKEFLSRLNEETIYKLANVVSSQTRKAVRHGSSTELTDLLTFRQLLIDIHNQKLKENTRQLEIWGEVLNGNGGD